MEQIGGVPPLTLDQPGDQARRDSADAVHLQGCRLACCEATTGPSTGDQPGDQACRVSAEGVHRQGCCRAYCDTATGPSDSDSGEDVGSLARAVHRQNSGRACDQAVDAATGPSNPDSGEDGGSLARAVRLQSRDNTYDHADHADQPGDQACRDSAVRGDATTGPSGSDSGANGRGPRKRPTKAEYAAMRKAEAMLGIWPSLLTLPSNE